MTMIDVEIRTSVTECFEQVSYLRKNNFQEYDCYVTARGVVNSISKSTSALLPRHLLLEIRVNLYKWRAVQCSYTVTGVTVLVSVQLVLDGKKRGETR